MAAKRAQAEDFLELVQRAKRGRLKLYIGFAAGVGKSYRMLQDAHALAKRHVDVVVGFVETHGREETEALVTGLEHVPRKQLAYRGVQFAEMDLDAILARRPEVVIVDELAHTNAPGMRNRKRYQDVLDLLAAGVNVIAAFNIQHMEGLNDVVQRVTGITVRETVPDRMLREADQVVNLDLAVDDLEERLRAGKIYMPDKVAWALENFFKPENLRTLRELALREVAETLERSSVHGPRSGLPTRVMVCLSSYPPHAAQLMRRGARMAGRLNTDWFVVYVETPSEAPDIIDAAAQRQIIANNERARELGAEFVHLRASDPVEAIIDFTRSHSIGHIIIGRSGQPWWKQVLGRSVPLRLVQQPLLCDLHIVSYLPGEDGG